jgi:uncharacterized membrane protein YfcA
MDSEIALAVLIISLAFGGEAIFGFGGGLIAIPLLSLFLGVRDAVTLVLIFQVCMGLLIFKSYRQIYWKAAVPLGWGLVAGAIAGTLFLSRANTTFLQLFLAFSILVFLAKMVFWKGLVVSNITNKPVTVGTGAVAGLFQGLIGTGGPVLAMYLTVAVRDKARLRATLIYLLFMVCVVRLVVSIPEHLISSRIIEIALFTLPFFLVAIVLGQVLHDKVKPKYYQAAIYIILLASASLLLVKALS